MTAAGAAQPKAPGYLPANAESQAFPHPGTEGTTLNLTKPLPLRGLGSGAQTHIYKQEISDPGPHLKN